MSSTSSQIYSLYYFNNAPKLKKNSNGLFAVRKIVNSKVSGLHAPDGVSVECRGVGGELVAAPQLELVQGPGAVVFQVKQDGRQLHYRIILLLICFRYNTISEIFKCATNQM